MPVRVPKYRLHNGSGQALVELVGRRIYLGKYGSDESREKYRRLIAAHMSATPDASQKHASVADPLLGPSVNEVILVYFRFAKTYYLKNSKPTDEIAALRACLRRLRIHYGSTPAADFGPRAFKLVREAMIAEGLSRKYINDSMARIRRMFRWAAAEEIVPASIYQGLSAVHGLRAGRSAAKESDPVLPVDDSVVDATLPHLSPVVADMVRLQRLTGMRPGEVCILRPCDVDRSSDEVWTFRPKSHKTQHHGRQRIVCIGPRGQEILRPYLLRDGSAFCFSPAESEKKRRRAQHEARKTPLQYGNRPGTNRRNTPKRKAGERYTTQSYQRAIKRACVAAFSEPEDLTGEELASWLRTYRWSPNQLRHTAATLIRREFGLEAAQIALGHSTANVTQVYAERDLAKGLEIARQIG